MTDRQVKVSLILGSTGAVKAMRATSDESGRTEHKLGQLDKGVKGLGLGALGAEKLFSGIASKSDELSTSISVSGASDLWQTMREGIGG